jgi:hypothetical protein
MFDEKSQLQSELELSQKKRFLRYFRKKLWQWLKAKLKGKWLFTTLSLALLSLVVVYLRIPLETHLMDI